MFLKNHNRKSSNGFTIVELMVAITLMMVIIASMLINLNAGRSGRNLNIAQNQLVSNIRKVQSYTLAGRNIKTGLTADFYILKFDVNNPLEYAIQAIYNTSVSPKVIDVETVKLPPGVAFSGSVVISRSGGLIPASYSVDCALLGYKLPFGRILMNNGCNVDNFFPSNDDYIKMVNFVSNTDNYSVSSDSTMSVTLVNDKGAQKVITIHGGSGRVDFQ